MNTERDNEIKKIEDMIENGELSVMSECAYGTAIADSERNNTLNNEKGW